jgi:2',3'-cyclic-nucleotide 2'-phosphodiesterase/3'-nucleotidase
MLEGIDILITGHQHRSFTTIINGTHVVQTAANASEFARITIDFEKVPRIDIQIEKTGDYPVDTMIEKLGENIEIKTQTGLDVALGRIEGPSLKITDVFAARLHKHPLVSFINQVQREASGADLSACALFNGVVGFNSEITYRDIVATYVYPNTLVVKKLDGRTLKLFLEKCAEYFSVKDDEIIVNPAFDDPKPLHFNYDMVDGIDYTIKVSNPIGQRIISMEYQGRPIGENDVFTLVMNNYRAVGGGDFMMAANCETVTEVNRDMVEILAEAISKRKVYTLHHNDNIQVIK